MDMSSHHTFPTVYCTFSDSALPTRWQSTIQLCDTSLEDYSFVFLSKSHYHHDAFFRAHPEPLEMENAAARNTSTHDEHYIQLTYDDLQYFEKKGCQWTKVVAPAVSGGPRLTRGADANTRVGS